MICLNNSKLITSKYEYLYLSIGIKSLMNFLIKIYRQALRYQMNDKIISLEIKLEEKRHEIELQKIEYLKLVEEIQNQKRLDYLYKQKKALLLDNFA